MASSCWRLVAIIRTVKEIYLPLELYLMAVWFACNFPIWVSTILQTVFSKSGWFAPKTLIGYSQGKLKISSFVLVTIEILPMKLTNARMIRIKCY